MLVSPGVVMARAPCAAQYCTASWGVLPARKAQASLKSRLSQNPQEDRAGKHGEAAAGFADAEQCFEPPTLTPPGSEPYGTLSAVPTCAGPPQIGRRSCRLRV